jgi:hypothetical protein
MSQLYRESIDPINGMLIGIVRTSDGAYIPLAEGNSDYESYKNWVSAGNTADPDPAYSTAAIQVKKWFDIKTQRDNRKAGGVLVDGNWYQTDDASRIQWLGVKDTARDLIAAGGKMTDVIQINGTNLMWKTYANTFVSVTNQLAYDVVQAIKDLDATLFAQAQTMYTNMMASATPATFDTTVGWNKTYAESV